jgi:hypothetical protein
MTAQVLFIWFLQLLDANPKHQRAQQRQQKRIADPERHDADSFNRVGNAPRVGPGTGGHDRDAARHASFVPTRGVAHAVKRRWDNPSREPPQSSQVLR